MLNFVKIIAKGFLIFIACAGIELLSFRIGGDRLRVVLSGAVGWCDQCKVTPVSLCGLWNRH